jgi:DNA-binding transcriptional regulator YiaG
MNTMDLNCPECGASLEVRGYRHHQRVGKYEVRDESVCLPQCPNEHGPMLTFKERLGYERRAVKLLLQSGVGDDGAVMRFARRTLGLKQTELAKLLDLAVETVSRWETGTNPAPHTTQLALAALIDRAQETGVDVLAEVPPVIEGQEFVIPPRAA